MHDVIDTGSEPLQVPSARRVGLWARLRMPPPRLWKWAFLSALGDALMQRQVASSGMTERMLPPLIREELARDLLPTEAVREMLPHIRSHDAWVTNWLQLADRAELDGDAAVELRLLLAASRRRAMPRAQLRALHERIRSVHDALAIANGYSVTREQFMWRTRIVDMLIERPSDHREHNIGGRPAFVLAPGLGVLCEEMDYIARPLLDAGAVVGRIDVAGHGGTPGPSDPEMLDVMTGAARVLAMQPDVDETQIHAFGNCSGGLLAVHAAHRFPFASVTTNGTPFRSRECVPNFIPVVREQLAIQNHRRSFWRSLPDGYAMNGSEAVKDMPCPHYAFAGAKDRMVPLRESIWLRDTTPAIVTIYDDQPHGCPGKQDEIMRLTIDRTISAPTADPA